MKQLSIKNVLMVILLFLLLFLLLFFLLYIALPEELLMTISKFNSTTVEGPNLNMEDISMISIEKSMNTELEANIETELNAELNTELETEINIKNIESVMESEENDGVFTWERNPHMYNPWEHIFNREESNISEKYEEVNIMEDSGTSSENSIEVSDKMNKVINGMNTDPHLLIRTTRIYIDEAVSKGSILNNEDVTSDVAASSSSSFENSIEVSDKVNEINGEVNETSEVNDNEISEELSDFIKFIGTRQEMTDVQRRYLTSVVSNTKGISPELLDGYEEYRKEFEEEFPEGVDSKGVTFDRAISAHSEFGEKARNLYNKGIKK